MGWWTREPDAVDTLCRSLKERWWEWNYTDPKFDVLTATLTHLSGVAVGWRWMVFGGKYRQAAYATTLSTMASVWTQQTPADSDRLWKAYQDHLAAKVNSKKADFDPTAKALAEAVLSGDRTAALALTDWIVENLKGEQK